MFPLLFLCPIRTRPASTKMPITEYPFISVVPVGSNSARISVKGPNARPRLWIRIINPDKNLAFEALAIVDTGADACAFPAQIAVQLGHNLESVKPKIVNTAKGPTEAYPHTSRVQILEVQSNGLPGPRVLYTIPDTKIDYTKGLPEFLLGRQQFLSRFVLKIDYPRQVFSIRWPVRPKHKKKIKRRRR